MKVGRTRTATDKTGRWDCNRKMGVDNRLAETDRPIDGQTG